MAGSDNSRETCSARASAWRSRDSIGYDFAAGSAAYLRRNRSIRPAVSTMRCLPVKYGWQTEHDFDADGVRGAAGLERVAALALHVDGLIDRMHVRLHILPFSS